MATLLRLLLVPTLLTAGLSAAQAQCSRSAKSRCARPAEAKSNCRATSEKSVAAAGARGAALLRVAAGPSLNGSGDYAILKTQVEYAPQLGRHWRLASRLAYIGGAESYQVDESFAVPRSFRTVNAEQEIHWLPFGAGRLVEVGVGGGIFTGYGREIGFSSAGYYRDATGTRRYNYTPQKEQGWHLGYIASLYADVALDPRAAWRLGGRVALQNDTRANILPGAQLQLSRAL